MTKRLPLEGVRVTDFTIHVAGPYGTAQLAWLGAEVIKIESREHLDILRGRNEIRAIDANMNKLAISLNLRHPDGLKIARSLIQKSDMVVESFTPGTMDKLGLSYSELKKLKPDIIMLSLSGFGQTGPEAQYRSWAAIAAAMGGLSAITGYSDGIPTAMRLSIDPITGQFGTVAALAALMHHRKTGEGQHIDYAVRDSIVSLVGEGVVGYNMTGVLPEPKGNDDDWASPHNCYRCKGEDEWVSIAVFTDEEWQALCKAMAREDLLEDPRFRESLARWENRQELDGIVGGWTRNYSSYEVMATLQGAGVAAMPVFNAEQLHNDPHLNARGFINEMQHRRLGKLRVFGPPYQLASAPVEIKWLGPDVGEHNKRVLKELLGLTDAEISRLEKEGALN